MLEVFPKIKKLLSSVLESSCSTWRWDGTKNLISFSLECGLSLLVTITVGGEALLALVVEQSDMPRSENLLLFFALVLAQDPSSEGEGEPVAVTGKELQTESRLRQSRSRLCLPCNCTPCSENLLLMPCPPWAARADSSSKRARQRERSLPC